MLRKLPLAIGQKTPNGSWRSSVTVAANTAGEADALDPLPLAQDLRHRLVSHWTVSYFVRAIIRARSTSSCERVWRSNRPQRVRAKSAWNRCGNSVC